MELYSYQLEALKHMKNGCILSAEVGTGKSITSLFYYYIRQGGDIDDPKRTMKDPKDLYIITTAMKRDRREWDLELAGILMSREENNVVVDSWNNIKKYKDVKDSFFIFDEQRLVGSGPWVKSFYDIAKHNEWILLSATPGDKWADFIPVFIANGFYRNKTDFMNQHAAQVDRYYRVTKYYNEGMLLKHKRDLLVDMEALRDRTIHHIHICCEYDREKYKTLIRKRWNPWTNEPMVNASELAYCLRRCTNEDESRIVKCLELHEDHQKLIIFYNFNYELEELKNAGWTDGTTVAEWNGHHHDPLPLSEERWIYLVQYTAGSEGWNCISTDTVLFFSQSYSYRSTVQAAGRIDRANTPYKDLYYYHLYSKSGIDLAIYRALKNKKEFNERRFLSEWK